jgi:hypothetical protein
MFIISHYVSKLKLEKECIPILSSKGNTYLITANITKNVDPAMRIFRPEKRQTNFMVCLIYSSVLKCFFIPTSIPDIKLHPETGSSIMFCTPNHIMIPKVKQTDIKRSFISIIS